MKDQVREFVLSVLGELNYDTSEVTGDTELGPAGLDMESLAIAELGVRVEDEYGVKFGDDEAEGLALMTLEEFTDAVASRLPAVEAAS